MSLISTIRTLVFRNVVLPYTDFLYRRVYKMDIGKGVRISRGARIDKTYPKGIHIGDYTAITSGASVLTHDFVGREHKEVWVGSNCFLGFGCIVLPGVRIGNNCIITGNTVVGRDVPDNSVVMGNPGRVVEKDIVVGAWGIRLDKGNSDPVTDPWGLRIDNGPPPVVGTSQIKEEGAT